MAIKKRLVLLLCITALTLIAVDVSGAIPLNFLRSGVREVFSPVQKGVGAITTPIGDFFEGITNSSDLKKENRELKKELSAQETKNEQYVGAVSENETLSKLLKLLLLSDATSGVGVRNSRTSIVGIAQGITFNDKLAFNFIDPDADMKKGDLLVTSGLEDGRFPANIPVGHIKSIQKDPSGLANKITITPLVNFSEVSIVSVIHTSDLRK